MASKLMLSLVSFPILLSGCMRYLVPGEMTKRMMDHGPPSLEERYQNGSVTVEVWTLGGSPFRKIYKNGEQKVRMEIFREDGSLSISKIYHADGARTHRHHDQKNGKVTRVSEYDLSDKLIMVDGDEVPPY